MVQYVRPPYEPCGAYVVVREGKDVNRGSGLVLARPATLLERTMSELLSRRTSTGEKTYRNFTLETQKERLHFL